MDMMVSVVIPTYKRSDYLKETIESILSQSYSNFEILVIDDNTEHPEYRNKNKELEAYYATDQRIRFFYPSTNLGGG